MVSLKYKFDSGSVYHVNRNNNSINSVCCYKQRSHGKADECFVICNTGFKSIHESIGEEKAHGNSHIVTKDTPQTSFS